jgi:hypothetical protein
MKWLVSKWAITATVLVALLPVSWSGEFDYDSYIPTTLRDIILEEQEHIKVHAKDDKTVTDVLLECRVAKYRVPCRYFNNQRPISEKKKKVITGWMEMLKFDINIASLYKQEIRVSDGTREHWIPIQEQLFPHLNHEVVKNDTIELFIILTGCVESEYVFIATEFVKPVLPANNPDQTMVSTDGAH